MSMDMKNIPAAVRIAAEWKRLDELQLSVAERAAKNDNSVLVDVRDPRSTNQGTWISVPGDVLVNAIRDAMEKLRFEASGIGLATWNLYPTEMTRRPAAHAPTPMDAEFDEVDPAPMPGGVA